MQYDFGNLESPLTGAALVNTHLEPWRNALHSCHSGTSRPSYAVAGTLWIQTSATPWVVNVFDGSNDVSIGTIDATTDVFTLRGNIKAPGSAGLPIYNSAGTLIATLGASTGTGIVLEGTLSVAGTGSFTGKFSFPAKGELTIASGVITVTGVTHTVDTQSDAASDDLDTINGSADGSILVLTAAHTDRTVIIKHNTGNILTPSGTDIALDNTSKTVVLQYNTSLSKWLVLSSPVVVDDVTLTDTGVLKVKDNGVDLDQMAHGTAGDLPYYGASGVPLRLARGTDGQILKLASGYPSWANESSGFTKTAVTLSSDASKIFTISSGNLYEFDLFQVYPSTDGVSLYVDFSADGGSTWISAGYSFAGNEVAAATGTSSGYGASGAAQITLNNTTIGNASSSALRESVSGSLRVNHRGGNSLGFNYNMTHHGTSANTFSMVGGGHLDSASAASVNRIRFRFSGGNMTGGKILMKETSLS